MSSVDLECCFEAAVGLAREAGEVIKAAWKGKKLISIKSSLVDLVTETDQEVEKLLITGFKSIFPDHKFIGEESTAAAPGEKCELTDTPTWIIDPVDGTMNFVHGFPHVAVSIALAVNKEVVVGVIYNPILDQLYTARKGQGSYCNDTKLEVSHQDDLTKALLLFEVGGGRDPERLECIYENLRSLTPICHGLRSMGSAALNMSQVAAGGADAYMESGIHCWDIAAGELIVREAGGVVLNTDAGPLDLMDRRVLCASSLKLAEEISGKSRHLTLERD